MAERDKRDEIREKIQKQLSSFSINWDLWYQAFIKVYDEAGGFVRLKKLTDGKSWYRIIVAGRKQGDPVFWAELEDVTLRIEELFQQDPGLTFLREKAVGKERGLRVKIEKKPIVRYGINEFVETLLPYHNKPSYNRNLEVEFKPYHEWSRWKDAVVSREIDVALHHFPMVLNTFESTPMFFWPFYHYHGYGIVKRKDAKDEDFKYWSLIRKREYLESSKIILEQYTDVHWVFKEFCKRYKCNWEKIEGNIIDLSINKGKIEFLQKGNHDIYCTNSIHITDLQIKGKGVEVIAAGKALTDYQNMNGLACSMEYFHNHKFEVIELIDTWFNDIRDQKEEWFKILNHREENPNKFMHFTRLLESVNSMTNSNVDQKGLVSTYLQYFDFFENPLTAYNIFEQSLNQDMERIYEIAKIQNRDNSKIGSIPEFKSQMQLIKDQLLSI